MHHYFDNYIKAVTTPHPKMQQYFDEENAFLASLLKQDDVLLDVGCGNGRNIAYLAPRVKKIVGIDYDPKMVEAARTFVGNRPNVELLEGDIYTQPFSEKANLTYATYNLLGSAETEVNQRAILVDRLLALTMPGGKVFLSVWSDIGIEFARVYYPHIGDVVHEIRGNAVYTGNGIFWRFSKDDLAKYAQDHARPYKIVDLAGIMWGMVIQN